MLLGEHDIQRAAEQRGRRAALADQEVGEALQPRQHGDQARPYRVVKKFCLQLAAPAAFW